jgi:DNA-binding phage protein
MTAKNTRAHEDATIEMLARDSAAQQAGMKREALSRALSPKGNPTRRGQRHL